MIELPFTIRRTKSGNHICLYAKKEEGNLNEDGDFIEKNEIKKNAIDNFTYELSNSITDIVESGNKKQLFNFGEKDDFIFRSSILTLLSQFITKYKEYLSLSDIDKKNKLQFQTICLEFIFPIIIQSIIRDILTTSIHGVFHCITHIK